MIGTIIYKIGEQQFLAILGRQKGIIAQDQEMQRVRSDKNV